MSQSLGEITSQISDPDQNAEAPPVRVVAARGKFNTMLSCRWPAESYPAAGARMSWSWRRCWRPLEPIMLVSSMIGYSLLLWGLFGCSFSVTVAHPWLAVQALFAATLIELVFGLTLGIFVNFEASLVGTIAGGVALVLIGRKTLAHLLDRVDYLLYQAF